MYCLAENLRVDGHYWPITPEGPRLFSDDDAMLEMNADNISLDFKGHSAISDARLTVGVTTPRGPDEGSVEVPKRLPAVVPKNLTMKNGTIRVSRDGMAVEMYGVGPQGVLVNIVRTVTDEELGEVFPRDADKQGNPYRWSIQGLHEWNQSRNRERAALRTTFMPNAAAYPVRNLRIENMRIRSQDYAVVLQGAGSVIRDSVIETDSGTALWLYGPNAVIENNTFIVHCIVRKQSLQGKSECQDMDAPIRLMHGDGSIIRNNHFVLKDSAPKRVLSLFDTGAITFEGNTFVGLDTPDQAVRAFRGPLQIKSAVPNRVDNSFGTRIKTWLE